MPNSRERVTPGGLVLKGRTDTDNNGILSFGGDIVAVLNADEAGGAIGFSKSALVNHGRVVGLSSTAAATSPRARAGSGPRAPWRAVR